MSQFELTLTIDGVDFTGWTATRLTRSCEQFPSNFEIVTTAKHPSGRQNVFTPFSACQIKINNELVLTGYIDMITDSIDAHSHTVTLMGRSKCADLIDCSAELSSAEGGFNGIPVLAIGGDIKTIADALCEPYGITTSINTKQLMMGIPKYQINIGDTPYGILELMARSQNLLIYDDVAGNLVLSDVGYLEHASGFNYGDNIEHVSLSTRYDGRYSEIDVFDSSIIPQIVREDKNLNFGKAVDNSIRHRRLMGFSEVPYVPTEIWAQKRADWEMARRQGRSQVVSVLVDSWVDKAGRLWQPNNIVTINTPSLNARWVIGSVTYLKDSNSGTTASLILMPPGAFNPEPASLISMDAGLYIGVGSDNPRLHEAPGGV